MYLYIYGNWGISVPPGTIYIYICIYIYISSRVLQAKAFFLTSLPGTGIRCTCG